MGTQRHSGHNTRENTRGCIVSVKEHGNCLHPCTKQCDLLTFTVYWKTDMSHRLPQLRQTSIRVWEILHMSTQRHGGHNTREKTRGCMVSVKEHRAQWPHGS